MEEKVVPESAPAPSEAPPVATVSAEEEVVRWRLFSSRLCTHIMRSFLSPMTSSRRQVCRPKHLPQRRQYWK